MFEVYASSQGASEIYKVTKSNFDGNTRSPTRRIIISNKNNIDAEFASQIQLNKSAVSITANEKSNLSSIKNM